MVADVGDFVRYNGNLEYAQNSFTRGLMKKYLIEGADYKIRIKIESKGRIYYKFELEGDGFWYPSESFDYSISFIKRKYDLR